MNNETKVQMRLTITWKSMFDKSDDWTWKMQGWGWDGSNIVPSRHKFDYT